MAIRCELANDTARGPGYGLIRIWGLSPVEESLEYCLERNQGTAPYLGGSGNWQAQEIWHRASLGAGLEPSTVIELPVGPEVVDPIVEQPQNVVCRLTVRCGGAKHPGALKIQRPLLSSKAHAPPKPMPSAPHVSPEPDEREAETVIPAIVTPVPEPPLPPPAPVPSPVPVPVWRRLALFGLPALALAAGGGWLWWDCRIPALPGPKCGVPPKATEGVAPPKPEPLPKNCAGLGADACLAAAVKGIETGQLELARQLLQEAGNLGAVKAYLHLARMYDPETWAADKSPVAQADWETAAYWYDEAARAGDREGMLGAGRLYCRNAGDPAFQSHALELLRKAAAETAGDAAAGQLLKECEEKLK